MKDLAEKTAVNTGAASGMGRFAGCPADSGMNIVFADGGPCLDARRSVKGCGVEVLAVPRTSDAESSRFATPPRALRSGELVCNNAGVAASRSAGHGPQRLAMGDGREPVGVIHGHRSFLPHLLEHATATSSTRPMAGYFPA
jgi:hypothetical protein